MRTMESNTWESDREPFEGVPGLRAAYYRALYRFALFMKRKNDESDHQTELDRLTRERQLAWNRLHSSPRANLAVDLFLWTFMCLVLLFCLTGGRKSVTPGDILPEQRTNTAIGRA